MKRVVRISAIFLIAAFFSSCEPSSITVGARLDAPYYERPVRPGPDYVWIDGEWYWEGGRYVYHNGYWGSPRRGHVWISGTWQQRGSGWYWRRGRWGRH